MSSLKQMKFHQNITSLFRDYTCLFSLSILLCFFLNFYLHLFSNFYMICGCYFFNIRAELVFLIYTAHNENHDLKRKMGTAVQQAFRRVTTTKKYTFHFSSKVKIKIILYFLSCRLNFF